MSEWRDLRREASFRGVPFWVDSDSVPVGRRTQLHEYPKRDQPLVEDMGRQTREYKFDGFIIGPDFISQRDRLLVALDTPGPGELVHPWFGRLTVTAGIAKSPIPVSSWAWCASTWRSSTARWPSRCSV